MADFGLARDIYEKDYYRIEDMSRPMPYKWMALEALSGFTFSSKSDVVCFTSILDNCQKKGPWLIRQKKKSCVLVSSPEKNRVGR